MQYRPIAAEFIAALTLNELETKMTEALQAGKMLHGDWKYMDGMYIQAMCIAAWRPMEDPSDYITGSGGTLKLIKG